jgi:hypothetical protein
MGLPRDANSLDNKVNTLCECSLILVSSSFVMIQEWMSLCDSAGCSLIACRMQLIVSPNGSLRRRDIPSKLFKLLQQALPKLLSALKSQGSLSTPTGLSIYQFMCKAAMQKSQIAAKRPAGLGAPGACAAADPV